jgi:hypothetical protein
MGLTSAVPSSPKLWGCEIARAGIRASAALAVALLLFLLPPWTGEADYPGCLSRQGMPRDGPIGLQVRASTSTALCVKHSISLACRVGRAKETNWLARLSANKALA